MRFGVKPCLLSSGSQGKERHDRQHLSASAYLRRPPPRASRKEPKVTQTQTSSDRATKVHELYTQQDQRAESLGWKRVSYDSCPRRLVGKRCKRASWRNPESRCWCERTGVGRLNDHGSTWRYKGGRYKGQKFVVWEPYGADGDALAALIETAATDGLEVRVTASVWNPPGTVGIAFYPKNFWMKYAGPQSCTSNI